MSADDLRQAAGVSVDDRRLVIVSGGQTGVDRAALDAAIELGIPHAGWCPRGRRAEDGRVPLRYNLRETESAEYRVRTRQNVLDSDATLILFRGTLSGGTALTFQIALECRKPCYPADLTAPRVIDATYDWILRSGVNSLNVAGPRESQRRGAYRQALATLREVLRRMVEVRETLT